MSEMRDEMIRTLDRVVEDVLTLAEREKADGGGTSEKLWNALVEQGFAAIGEADGEIGFADTMALIQRAAYHAAPVPLGETIMARRLLARAGIAPPDGAITLVPPAASGAPVGKHAGVPFGRTCAHAVVASGAKLQLLSIAGAIAHESINQAGEARDDIDTSKAEVVAQAQFPNAARTLQLEGALLRTVQLSGALERALEHCMTWVNDRVQFGRPIARFQAMQHAMAVMASEVAAANAATDMAVEKSIGSADWFAVAVAKSRAGEAAGRVANGAHAAFGAMGFTREHQLHYTTRRLWAWRDDFGSEVVWQTELGRAMATAGGRGLWRELTAHG